MGSIKATCNENVNTTILVFLLKIYANYENFHICVNYEKTNK